MRCYVSYRYNGNEDHDVRPEYSWMIVDMPSKSRYMTDEYFRCIMNGIIDVTAEKYGLECSEIKNEDIVLLNLVAMESESE